MTALSMRLRRVGVILAIVASSLDVRAALAQAPALVLGSDPRIDSSRFRITVFATGLNFPYSMQQLADGSILVGTSRPNSAASPSFFDSTGELVRLVDSDGDGVADSRSTLYTGLPGEVTSVRQAGGLVFVTSAQTGSERISILRKGATEADPYTLAGALAFTFPVNWEHTTYTLAVRATPGVAGAWDVFFNVGSADNNATSGTVGLSGLATGTLEGASIYRVTISDSGGVLQASGLRRIASGLRNAAGIAIQPSTGDLYFDDNGIDGLTDPTEPLSADELNRIAALDIGGPVRDFGFPSSYTAYRTGALVGDPGVAPLVAFQPIPAPDGSESEGAVEIAFAPPRFPAGLNHGVFIGFHGQFSLGGVSNEENPVVFYDLATGQYFHFVSNTSDVGHLDGLLATDASLFLADVAPSGPLTGAGTGVIYQIAVNDALPVLTVVKTNQAGTVTSAPPGIQCGADCSEPYAVGQQVTLTATPGPAQEFRGWSGGGCSGPEQTCTVTMSADVTVTADFGFLSAPSTANLGVTVAGTGQGTVTSAPAGIACAADCTEAYPLGTVVTLTATPDRKSRFAGWSGDPDCVDGVVTLSGDTTCTATFVPKARGKGPPARD